MSDPEEWPGLVAVHSAGRLALLESGETAELVAMFTLGGVETDDVGEALSAVVGPYRNKFLVFDLRGVGHITLH